MPNYVAYNPASSPVAGLTTSIFKSFPEEREAEIPTPFLKEPTTEGITFPAKVVGGVLQNLTQGEKDAIAAAKSASAKTALKAAAKSIFLTPESPEHQAIKLGFQVLAEIMVSEINVLRAQHSLAARTNNQLNTQFKNEYEAKIDAL